MILFHYKMKFLPSFFFSWCFCLLSITSLNAQRKVTIDSLLSLIKKDKEDTSKINHLNNLSREYIDVCSYDTGLYYNNAALHLAQQLKNSTNESIAVQSKKGIAASYGNMGIVYMEQGDYPKALEYYLKALKIVEETGDKNRIAIQLGNIGSIYNNQYDYPKALEYYIRALKLFEELGNKEKIATVLSNTGIIHWYQEDYPRALEYYLKALKIREELKSKSGMSNLLGNIGAVYHAEKNYPEALEYYLKALKAAEETGDKTRIAIWLGNTGGLYTALKKYDEAEKYLLKSLFIAEQISSLDDIKVGHQHLSELYEAMGKFAKALEHYKKAMVVKDSIFNKEKNQEIIRKIMNYEFEKKEANAQKTMEIEIEHYKQTRNLVILGSISGLALIFVGYNRYRLKQKIKYQKQLTNLERKALHLQMNPHFIFNSLGSIGSFIVQNDAKSSLKYLASFSKLIRIILENSKDDYVTLYKEMELLQNYLELEQLRSDNKFDFSVIHDIPMADRVTVPPMLIQPFVENAVLHGILPKNDRGNIAVRFYEKNKTLVCEIEDDGVGRTFSKTEKNTTHQSMAMDIIQNRLNTMSAMTSEKMKFRVEDKKNDKGEPAGTKVVLEMPVKYLRLNLN
ncbi:MAG: tetratricopeptide repeat protein [Bacteroidetes bacterium]|nr:MAG: tetratricopeptide repeat protein [Bacteroidota bacterium]